LAIPDHESDEIVAGTEKEPSANKADELKDWKRKNKLAVTYMWSHIEPEWQHLVLGETSGSVAFAKLKKQFEASNFSRCIALRKAFYGAVHDTSQPIEIYIQSVVDVKSQLEAIGVKVDDDALKDVILMNLDDTFSGVRTSLLTQPTEPSFDTIRSVLGSSTHIVHADIPIKPEDHAMATNLGEVVGGRTEGVPAMGIVLEIGWIVVLGEVLRMGKVIAGATPRMTITATVVVTWVTMLLVVLPKCLQMLRHGF